MPAKTFSQISIWRLNSLVTIDVVCKCVMVLIFSSHRLRGQDLVVELERSLQRSKIFYQDSLIIWCQEIINWFSKNQRNRRMMKHRWVPRDSRVSVNFQRMVKDHAVLISKCIHWANKALLYWTTLDQRSSMNGWELEHQITDSTLLTRLWSMKNQLHQHLGKTSTKISERIWRISLKSNRTLRKL